MRLETERLDFYFDFADPVAYAISTQVDGWARDAGLGVRWVAISAATEVRRVSDERAEAGQALASAFGYPLFPRFETDSRPASRILSLADPGHRAQLTMRLFQAWYATDLPPYSDDLLDGLSRDCSIDRGAMQTAVLNHDHPADSSIADEVARVFASGASSFPAIVLPTGAIISFGDLDTDDPVADVDRRAQGQAFVITTSTRPARCYLPPSGGPESFCRWCSCERG